MYSPLNARSMAFAKFATVGFSNNVRSGSCAVSSPYFSRSKNTSRVPSSECPPRSKKLSCAPTRCSSKPNTCEHISTSSISSGVRGATYFARVSKRDCVGAGNALRLTFPFGVSGRDSNVTKTDGTMYAGSFVRRYSRSPPKSASFSPLADTTYPTRLASEDAAFHAVTTACFTDG